MNQDEVRFQYNRKKWRTRRRMAISSFVSIIGMVGYYVTSPLFMTTEQVGDLAEFNSIIITLIGFFSSVIMLYIGAATYDDSGDKKYQQ